jgi:uncharacterized protein (DUF934 family)
MLLLDREGPKEDSFFHIENGETNAGKSPLIPFAALDPEFAAQHSDFGVLVENTIKPAALEPWFDRLALITIRFPSSTDGRGFSLARQLRRRGFTGILRASGPLISDQFPQALACGFDEVEIPDASAARQPAEQWLEALGRISLSYQRDYGAATNILEQRRNSRRAGAN